MQGPQLPLACWGKGHHVQQPHLDAAANDVLSTSTYATRSIEIVDDFHCLCRLTVHSP